MKRMKEKKIIDADDNTSKISVVQSTALEWESLGLQLWLGLNQTQV